MSKHLLILIASAWLLSQNTNAAEVQVVANDGYALSATLKEPKTNSNKAVLLLHQCNADKTMYSEVSQRLAEKGFYTLGLDFRGMGSSASDEYSFASLASLPEASRGKSLQNITQHWPSDVAMAIKFLQKHIGENAEIGVMGASCGGSLVVSVSPQHPFSFVVLMSSQFGKKNIEKYQTHLSDKPSLIISSIEDATYQSSVELFTAASNPLSKFIGLQGSGHGLELFEQDSNLSSNIVDWIAR